MSSSSASSSRGAPPTDWVRLVASLKSQLVRLSTTTNRVSRYTNQLASGSDVAAQKHKVDAEVHRANTDEVQPIHATLAMIQKYIQSNAADTTARADAAGVTRDAKKVLDGFQSACNGFVDKCHRLNRGGGSGNSSKKNSANNRGGGGKRQGYGSSRSRLQDNDDVDDDDHAAIVEMDEYDEATESQSLLKGGNSGRRPQQQQQQQLQLAYVDENDQQRPLSQRELFERQMEQEYLEERSKDVKEILENVQDINDIFAQINAMVGEQGQHLDDVENTVTEAEDNTHQAVDDLNDAASRQKRAWVRKMTCIFIIFVFFALVLAILTAR